MKLLVFGASGHVGHIVVQQALARGHDVTVFVHKHSPFTESERLHIARGDVHQTEDVSGAIAGSEGIISTLGSIRGPAKDVLSSAMQHVIPAMKANGVTRIVTLTGYSAFTDLDSPHLLDRAQHGLFGMLAPKVLRDAEDHIRLLQQSDLDWTTVRAPAILNFGGTGHRFDRTSPLPWQTVPRAAVASALLDLAESKDYLHQAPFVHRP